ncbi:MAG: NAD-dependent epimerase/dehydratase family protein [Gammaproteobacteria bacterium]|nr:NAD-dependent epimerase/dehydratase family protein [Gammaproteobacteria bacterium]
MTRVPKSILVSGANGVVGQPLVKRLKEEGFSLGSISRFECVGKIQWDLDLAPSEGVIHQISRFDCLVHCAPIWLLPRHLSTFKTSGITRLIVFSSTSVISKQKSSDSSEQRLVERLSSAESAVLSFCHSQDISVTILRPTMIYGYGRDQNISHIAGVIKKFGFMILVGKAEGLRQPVHADDIVDACLNVLKTNSELEDTYNLAGGEALSYRSMVERIFNGLKIKPRIVSIPLSVFRFLLWAASKVTSFDYTPEMANRMNQDLSYSNESATEDFNYNPQAFLEDSSRDLV